MKNIFTGFCILMLSMPVFADGFSYLIFNNTDYDIKVELFKIIHDPAIHDATKYNSDKFERTYANIPSAKSGANYVEVYYEDRNYPISITSVTAYDNQGNNIEQGNFSNREQMSDGCYIDAGQYSYADLESAVILDDQHGSGFFSCSKITVAKPQIKTSRTPVKVG